MRHIHQPVILNEREESIKCIISNCHCERPFWTRGNPSGTYTSSESGRSLIEMLGVLAVMGVLTIGAIAGFHYAMNKQRANATVNYVNQLAIEGSRQMLAGSNHLSLLDYPDKTPSGYEVELGLLKDTNAYFEVYVKDVPEAVCSQIQAMAEGWRGLDTLWVNKDGKDCNKETNTMSFIFTDSLSRGTSGTRCTSDEGCSWCQTCQRGFCTDTDSVCPGDTPHCVSGSCEKCPAGEFQDSRGKCYKCNESQTLWVADKAECDKCLGTRVCYNGATYPCDTKATLYWFVQKEACQACGNRYPSNVTADGMGSCDYCNGTIIIAEDGAQLCHGNCPEGEIWVGSKCKRCDDLEYFYGVVKEDCISKCKGTRFFQASANQCTRCDVAQPAYWAADRESCLACPNRYMTSTGTSGTCHYCDGTIITAENGEQYCQGNCPEGEFWWGSKCVKCDDYNTSSPGGILKSECIGKCKGTRFFQASGNQCIHCDVAQPAYWAADRESCLACPNRYMTSSGTCYYCNGTVSADGKSCMTETDIM